MSVPMPSPRATLSNRDLGIQYEDSHALALRLHARDECIMMELHVLNVRFIKLQVAAQLADYGRKAYEQFRVREAI